MLYKSYLHLSDFVLNKSIALCNAMYNCQQTVIAFQSLNRNTAKHQETSQQLTLWQTAIFQMEVKSSNVSV